MILAALFWSFWTFTISEQGPQRPEGGGRREEGGREIMIMIEIIMKLVACILCWMKLTMKFTMKFWMLT